MSPEMSSGLNGHAQSPRPVVDRGGLSARDSERRLVADLLHFEGRHIQHVEALDAEHIEDVRLRLVFESMRRVSAAGQVASAMAVHDDLQARGELRAAGGPASIFELSSEGVEDAPPHLRYTARRIIEAAAARRMIQPLGAAPARLRAGAAAGEVLRGFDEARTILEQAAVMDGPRFEPAPRRVRSCWSEARRPPLPTGLRELDKKLGGGFIRGRTCVLIAPTGRGKTSLAILSCLALMAAGIPVLYISTELPEREVLARFLGQVLRQHWRVVTEWGPEEAADLEARAVEHLALLTVVEFDGSESLTSLSARHAAEVGTAPVVVVDVVQDLATAALRSGAGDARAAVRCVSGEAKAVARRLDTVVVLLSHTSRSFSRDRDGAKLKSASDFESAGRDSADLEQDAATVLYLDTDDCPTDGTAEARLHIAKCSGAGRGQTVGLRYHGRTCSFEGEACAALPPELRPVLQAVGATLGPTGRTTVDNVREELGVGKRDVAAPLDALARRGLIRRGYGIELTDQGRALLQEAG